MVRRAQTEISLGETINTQAGTNAGPVASRRPLIFLHGALGSSEQVLPLADRFRGDRPVFAPDFSGHGREAGKGAGKGPGRGDGDVFSIRRFADDLCGFLDRNGIERADLFGYSMGGYVGLHAARHTPDRIGRIMTLGTKFAWDETTAKKEAARLDPALIESKVPGFAARLKELHGDAWPDVARSTARMMLDLGARPALTDNDFQSIPHRALLSVGERDEMVSVGETVKTSRHLPAGELLVIPGLKHPIERADQELLVRCITEYFSTGEISPPDAALTLSENNTTYTP